MRERPILFNSEMVRALLEGRKTQTRRVINKVKPFEATDEDLFNHILINDIVSPYGKTGDQLWVRETFAIESNADLQDVYLEPNNPLGPVRNIVDGQIECFECPRYRASEPDILLGDDGIMRWQPSIFLPRWASRIQLEVTNIRIERVQELSRDGAKSEGVVWDAMGWMNYLKPKQRKSSAVQSFGTLWDSINKKRGYGWDSNPWVWVVEFEVINL